MTTPPSLVLRFAGGAVGRAVGGLYGIGWLVVTALKG